MRTLRQQLLLGTVDRPPYIPPIPSNSDYGDVVKRDETLITDDPHYVTMGWLAEIGKQSIIKLTNDQIDTLYDFMYLPIYQKWHTYVSNDRKGYKFGLIATVDSLITLRNYDYKRLSSPKLLSVVNGIATIAFESFYRNAGVTKHSRTKADIYKVRMIMIDRNGTIIGNEGFYAYHDDDGNYVKLDYKPNYY